MRKKKITGSAVLLAEIFSYGEQFFQSKSHQSKIYGIEILIGKKSPVKCQSGISTTETPVVDIEE